MARTISSEGPNTWAGLGVNILATDSASLSNALDGINFRHARLVLDPDDPGLPSIANSDSDWDTFWARKIAIYQVTHLTLASRHITVLYSFTRAPESWLDSTRELRGDALLAYARMAASAMYTCHRHNLATEYIELCNAPSRSEGHMYMTPPNMVILVNYFKTLLAARSLDIHIIGPALDTLLPHNQPSEPYITVNAQWDAWSLRVVESEKDVIMYNTGSFVGRVYVKQRLDQTLRFMDRIRPGLRKIVTMFSSNASRFGSGIDYGPSASETVEYALRIIDTSCHIVNSGCMIAFAWFLLGRKHDHKALLRPNGTKRPQRDALSILSHCLPVGGTIYTNTDLNEEDETIKVIVCKQNTFGIVLSRAQNTDGTMGVVQLEIDNPAWQASSVYQITLTLTCFPSYVSTNNMPYTAEITSGVLNLKMSGVPYGCAIFIRGDVYDV